MKRVLQLVLLLLVPALAGVIYVLQAQQLQQNTLTKLQAVNQLKARQLDHWLQERLQDGTSLSSNPIFVDLAEQLVSQQKNIDLLTSRLKAFSSVGDYGQIALLDAQGNIRLSTTSRFNHPPHETQQRLQETLTQKTPQFTDLIVDKDGKRHLDMLVPLWQPTAEQAFGLLIFHIDPEHFIDPLMQHWPGTETSAQSFLARVRDEQLHALTPLTMNGTRYAAGQPLSGYQPLIVQRQQGMINGPASCKDVSGQDIWLYCNVLPRVNWGVISQISAQEMLTPLYQFLAGFVLLGYLLLAMAWKGWQHYQQVHQLQQQAQLAEQQNLLISRSRDYYESLFQKAPVPYQSLDTQGNILTVNQAWLELFGYDSADKVVGHNYAEFITSDSITSLKANFPVLMSQHRVSQVPFTIFRADGTTRQVTLEGRVSSNDAGEVERTHCVLTDITEKLHTESALQLAASVFEHTSEGIMVTTPDRRIVSINAAFTQLLGFSETDVLGKTPGLLKSGRHNSDFYAAMWLALDTHGHWQGEIWNRKKNGELIAEWLSISSVYDQQGKLSHYVGVFADISRLKDSEAQLEFLAHHDPLTGLANRRLLHTHLTHAIESAWRHSNTQLALLMIDLDRFKMVNDSYGHAIGDELLQHIAALLQRDRRHIDTVARMGGDEFAVLMHNIQQPQDAARVALSLIQDISRPLQLSNGVQVSVGATIGISLYPQQGKSAEELIQQADTALYEAKTEGKGNFLYFSREMTFQAQERLLMEAQLKQALALKQFRIYFQPQLDIATGKVIGAEALVRWQHPDMGIVSPARFIPVCEETGLITELGDWVLKETCRQGKAWLDEGYTPITLAVNVAAAQWQQSNWVERVSDMIASTGFAPHQLELEITESGLMRHEEEAVKTMQALRQLGVRISIDDFGTGYSSLSYLKRLPLDKLKIDKSFIDDLPAHSESKQIVNTILAMAHSLKLKVLAEGVEQSSQLGWLKEQQCDSYQGYLFSPPLPADEFTALLRLGHNSANKG